MTKRTLHGLGWAVGGLVVAALLPGCGGTSGDTSGSTGNSGGTSTTGTSSTGTTGSTGTTSGTGGMSGAAYTITSLGFKQAYAINNNGQIVGIADGSAYLYKGGSLTTLAIASGSTQSIPYAVNATGQAAGISFTTQGLYHAGVFGSAQATDIGTLPGDVNAEAHGIAGGVVVGNSADSNGNVKAFVYQNGKMTDLGALPGATDSQATAINDAGQIVGETNDHHTTFDVAFLYQNGKMTSLGTLLGGNGAGNTGSGATAINGAGQAVGRSKVSARTGYAHACLFSGGSVTDLGTLPGANTSAAYAINNSGQIVGKSPDNAPGGRAFLYTAGKMVDLNTLIPANSGWTLTDVTGINDQGQICGYENKGDGSIPRAFLLTPVSQAAVRS